MAKIDPHSMQVGIENVMLPQSEVGRANLPQSLRVLPSDEMAHAAMEAALPPTLKEELARFLEPDITHRELLVPDVLFAVLERCREEVKGTDAGKDEAKAQLAEVLEELLADKQMCDMFRNLLVSG
jgi:hypothetical protein